MGRRPRPARPSYLLGTHSAVGAATARQAWLMRAGCGVLVRPARRGRRLCWQTRPRWPRWSSPAGGRARYDVPPTRFQVVAGPVAPLGPKRLASGLPHLWRQRAQEGVAGTLAPSFSSVPTHTHTDATASQSLAMPRGPVPSRRPICPHAVSYLSTGRVRSAAGTYVPPLGGSERAQSRRRRQMGWPRPSGCGARDRSRHERPGRVPSQPRRLRRRCAHACAPLSAAPALANR